MTEPRFKIGDVVALKSGGPKMTVFIVHPNQTSLSSDTLVDTCWFDDRELKRDSFSEPELLMSVVENININVTYSTGPLPPLEPLWKYGQ